MPCFYISSLRIQMTSYCTHTHAMNVKLELHNAICLTDSVVFMLGHFVNFRVMRHESTSFNRIIAKKFHHAILHVQ